jgi:hypothetical protein
VLVGLPNVTGVGFGWKETRGELTATAAWRVYVRHKVPRVVLPARGCIPALIDGLATDVVVASRGLPVAALAEPTAAPPGTFVSNLRAVLNDAPVDRGASGLGTLGFFGLVNGRREREVVLVSNRHVLLAHGAGRGDPVYRPAVSPRGHAYVIRRDSVEPFAEVLDEGAEENHRFAYPGEPGHEYFVDCATARVLDVREAHGVARRPARLHPLDVLGTRAPRVRVLAGASGSTSGRIVDVAAPVETAGSVRLNNILIRGDGSAFIGPGDSGALVVNEREEAIGLLWGCGDPDAHAAYASHIHPVLDRLDVTMMTRALS